jgi:hypothetical protein
MSKLRVQISHRGPKAFVSIEGRVRMTKEGIQEFFEAVASKLVPASLAAEFGDEGLDEDTLPAGASGALDEALSDVPSPAHTAPPLDAQVRTNAPVVQQPPDAPSGIVAAKVTAQLIPTPPPLQPAPIKVDGRDVESNPPAAVIVPTP